MTTIQSVDRDERTLAVENASYRLSYHLLSYGILIAVAYRSFVQHESAWDLFALVIVGGAVNAAYQASHQVLARRWLLATVITMVVAAAIALVATLVMHHRTG